MSHGAAMIWCPFADEAQALVAGEALVAEGLVACANILPAITSVFRWDGQVQRANEVAAIFKTTAALLDRACEHLAILHPYDTPAIMGWLVDSAPHVTRDWLESVTGSAGDGG